MHDQKLKSSLKGCVDILKKVLGMSPRLLSAYGIQPTNVRRQLARADRAINKEVKFKIEIASYNFNEFQDCLADYNVTKVSYKAPWFIGSASYENYLEFIDCEYGPLPDNPDIYIMEK